MPANGKNSNDTPDTLAFRDVEKPIASGHPMNYRHAFHAGNFADVMKHITLSRVIEHLKHKEKPFRFIDTHAGVGLYDLSANEAQRSGEWRNGIAKLLGPNSNLGDAAEPTELLQPYLDVIPAVNGNQDLAAAGASGQSLRWYPGAGELARRLMRSADNIVLNELHADDAGSLRRAMAGDARIKCLQLDGWTVAKSLLPPKERRGVMLIDPPFESPGEFSRLQTALEEAVDRFATGITLLWYPIKAGGADLSFVKRMASSGFSKLLHAELLLRHRDTQDGLNGSGLLIHNPTYDLDRQLGIILPHLLQKLSSQPGASWQVNWLTRD